MALSPALREMVKVAAYEHETDLKPARGIIPFDASPGLDPHDVAVCTAAEMINKALTGPAIGVYELAERIVAK